MNKTYEDGKRAREFAKQITKVLRANGIKAGIVRGNGTTSPAGADKYEAYIPHYKEFRTETGRLYMSYTMDEGKTMKRIKDALDVNEICYAHKGKESGCFAFAPYPLVIGKPKKAKEDA